MKCKIKKNFEAAFYNPAICCIEGGSWHARITIDGAVPIYDIRKIQNIIDQFDHSTIAPVEYIKKEEIENISKRYTLLKNCVQLSDMFIGTAKAIINEIKKENEKIAERAILFEFWQDFYDVAYVIERKDLINSEVEVIEHVAAD